MNIFYHVGRSAPDDPDPGQRIEYHLVRRMARDKGWRIHATVAPSPGLEDCVAHNYRLREIDWRRPQDWERDADALRAVEEGIAAIERQLGLSVTRCLYADRSLNREYTARNYEFPDSPLVEYVRRDPENARILIRRMYRLYTDLLDEIRPDAVLLHSYAGAGNLLLALICEARGIPYFNPLCVNTSAFLPRFRNYFFFHHDKDLARVYRRKAETGAPVSDEARAYLQKMQEVNTQYIEWDRILDRKRLAVMRPRNIARNLFWETVELVRRPFRRRPGEGRPLRLHKVNYLKKNFHWLKLYFRYRRGFPYFHDFSDEALASMRYIYFPLHQDPEESLMTGAPAWGEATRVVELLSKMIPFGYRLLVRDHMDTMVWRSPAFHRHLVALPNVTLVEPRCPSTKFIRHADLVITIHGSTGWEGLIMERPVITLNRTFYDLTGLTHKVADINHLDRDILEALGRPRIADRVDYWRRLGWLVDADRELGFANDDDAVEDGLRRIEAAVAARQASRDERMVTA